MVCHFICAIQYTLCNLFGVKILDWIGHFKCLVFLSCGYEIEYWIRSSHSSTPIPTLSNRVSKYLTLNSNLGSHGYNPKPGSLVSAVYCHFLVVCGLVCAMASTNNCLPCTDASGLHQPLLKLSKSYIIRFTPGSHSYCDCTTLVEFRTLHPHSNSALQLHTLILQSRFKIHARLASQLQKLT